MAANTSTEPRDRWPEAVVSSYRVVPAWMKKKEGGATPEGRGEGGREGREREGRRVGRVREGRCSHDYTSSACYYMIDTHITSLPT